MLVLSRQKNEAICIHGGIVRVVVLEIIGGNVRLGIDAPKEIEVHREEVQRAIDRSKQQSDSNQGESEACQPPPMETPPAST